MRYGICADVCWVRLPLRDPFTMLSWIGLEELPTMEFDNLDSATNALKERYSDKIYTKNVNDGTEVLLCYIIDNDYNIIAALDYDGNVIMRK